jgi:hypothetical protein
MHLKLEQDKAEWRSRHSINLMMDDKMYWFRWFPASMKLSEIRDRFKFVAYKEIKEDLRTASDMDILEYYKDQGWFYAKITFIKGKKFIYAYFANQDKLEKAVVNSLGIGLYDVWIIPQKKKNFNTFISSGSVNPDHVTENVDVGTSSSKESNEGSSSALKYTEKDVKAIVSRAIEEQIKEKEMIKENVNKSVREVCKMMGLKLGDIDFSVSGVNKDRQTEVLFKEIQKANAEKMAKEKSSSSSMVMTSVDEEEIVELVNRYRKGALPARNLEKGLDTNGGRGA